MNRLVEFNMDRSTLLMLAAVGSVALLAYTVMTMVLGKKDAKLQSRLSAGSPASSKKAVKKGVGPLLQKMGQAAAKPFMPSDAEKQTQLKRSLAQAGIYAPSAARAVIGGKVILLVIGLVGGYLLGTLTGQMLLALSVCGLIGYLLPTIWLKMQVKSNLLALECGLPDALDLMVVCVEAGLTIDGAMQRVSQELALVHPALSRELQITHMETHVGLPRAEAMKNLGIRTGCNALQSLSAMLIQAERFGTSIAASLRVHSESMRLQRFHRAEEMAAKSSVKMSFPLVLCIFPATFIVLMGPTAILIMNSPFFN
jgi:tight adherence protein C